MSLPPGTEMFQFPGFASIAYVFSDRYPIGVGCPIRISTDQRLLAAPHGFSQRATSFIASWCQGIHRMPFLCSRIPIDPSTGDKPNSPCTGTIPTLEGVELNDPAHRIHSAHTNDTSPAITSGRHIAKTPLNINLAGQGQPSGHYTTHLPVRQHDPTIRPETHQNLIHKSKNTNPIPLARVDFWIGHTTDTSRRPPLGDDRQNAPNRLPSAIYPAVAQNHGDDRDRTGDPLLAKQVLSQLSYAPTRRRQNTGHQPWWAREDLNLRPHAYQACALTN